MIDIVLQGAFGDQTKIITISRPQGAGNIFFIDTDHWHDGEIILTQNFGWQFRFNFRSYLTGNDVIILIDLIERELFFSEERRKKCLHD